MKGSTYPFFSKSKWKGRNVLVSAANVTCFFSHGGGGAYCMTGGKTRQDIGAEPNLWLFQVFLEHVELIRFAVSTSVNDKYIQCPYADFCTLFVHDYWQNLTWSLAIYCSLAICFFSLPRFGFSVFSIVPVFILVVICKEKPSSFETGRRWFGEICCPPIQCIEASRTRGQQ